MPEPLFAIGEAVVCTDDCFAILHALNHTSHPQITTPRKGPVYHVRGYVMLPHAVGLLLAEITNEPMWPGGPEANFNQERFAKVPPVEDVSLTELIEETITA